MIGLAMAMMAAQPGAAEAGTRAAIARIAAVDGMVHAVIAVDPTALDQARAIDRGRRARGALYGMAILLKDNIEADGPLPTTAGSLALAANVTHRDAALVARLRGADAVILGKANLSEWANFRSPHSVSGWSAVGGQTRNPWVLDRTPCGSSAGSAAAVAAGEVAGAIGSETDGSITCPASMTGVVGLKPTVGLVSRSGIVPISSAQDTAGPIAVDVATAARLLGVIAGSDPGDAVTRDADAHRADYAAALRPDALRGVRIGVARFSGLRHPAVAALFERTLATLRARGAILVDIAKSGIDDDALGKREELVLDTEFHALVDRYLAATPKTVTSRSLVDLIAFDRAHADTEMPLFAQETFAAALATRGLDDPAYRRARDEAKAMAGGAIDRLLADNHVAALVFPTAPPAFPIDPVSGDAFPDGYGMGGVAAVAGYPHLTVPMGLVRGLPVGLSFVGAAWSEAILLGLGYGFEQAGAGRAVPAFVPTIQLPPAVSVTGRR